MFSCMIQSRLDHKQQQIRISITDKIVLAGDVKIMLWYDSLYKRVRIPSHFATATHFEARLFLWRFNYFFHSNQSILLQ